MTNANITRHVCEAGMGKLSVKLESILGSVGHSLCCNSSTLLFEREGIHGQYTNSYVVIKLY